MSNEEIKSKIIETLTKNNNLSEQIKTLLTYLNQNLYGKEEAVRLALLSAVANESIFFMGPPGTAKSMISRRIAAAFKDFYKDGKFTTGNGGYFEYLMNEFSTPDEICGPVDLSALNEKPSRYNRQTEGYLPSAKVAFLDEIWKSGPAILNTLLTIINEKKFHNGKNVEKVPLVSLSSASNEPPEKNRGLEALWDRFILRVFVNPVTNEDDFFKVVDDRNKELVLTDEQKSALLEISDVEKWQSEINKVVLSDEAKAVITAIRQELTMLNGDGKHKSEDGENYYVSDRRWKKIVHILKTSAFLNGRDSVDLMDCSLIEYAIWNTDKQHDEVGGIVEKILKQNGIGKSTEIGDISDQIDEFKDSVDEKWFEFVDEVPAKPSEDKIVTIGNKKCYECTRNSDGETWYVGVGERDNYSSSYHNIYRPNKEYYDYYSFTRTGDTIRCNWDFTVNKTKAVPAVPAHYDENSPKLFEPVAKKTVMESFDKEEYTPIVEQIDSEIADLHNFRAENEKPFSENAFANASRYSPILLNKIDESIKTLEDKKLKLKEQHERYASDSNVKSDFELCDIILRNGTFKKAKSKVADTDIIAKVCMKCDTTNSAYGIAWEEFNEYDFEGAKKKAEEYGKDFSEPYNSGWMLPTIEQLKQIYVNSHEKNDFNLSGKYWSSSTKGD
ncbi:MAG: AAA family ATPase, partial [Treponema sp.]|nr:AAA family ATPase [Treponema sp.]